jgi:transcriptional regulator with XRE-family HTH domain
VQNFRFPETAIVASLGALGQMIRAKRRATSLRIDDAAALSGVSVDLLSRLENGKSGVSTARVLQVMDALGLAMVVVDKEKLRQLPLATDQVEL